MSTTIDSLQIEIQSNSTNASKGLDALAESLGKLKQNGSFKTVSNNLNNLAGALKNLPNVHSASNALRTLANSIEKLKGVGSVSSLSNSLSKLPTALSAIQKIDLDRASSQIQKIATAVAPLSSLKAGGLNTMVSGMKKLGEVTESLDDDTIEKFAQKVELLSRKLAPLSEKMTTIKAGFSAINSKARSAASGVKEFGDKVDATTLNLSGMVTVIQGVYAALQPLITLFANAIHRASEWDGIKYQFGNAFGEQADEYYEKITKVTDALRINKQAFMENSAMAASMLIGFGVDKSDAREMGVGYTELAYDIWAAFNNVYKTLDGADGAMAAVRSAISGEVEPIRRAGFTIVDSQLAITAANHGLAYSTTEATEAQKSYLRYLTLVDQAQKKGIVGTYAREMNTAEGMMRTFSQQLKSLSQAFGSLFLPILTKVMPYLQAFVELLTEAVHWVAAFFGIEIQDISGTWNDYSSGVSDAVENTENVTGALDDATAAAKELKNATLGIDELNVISPPSASSSNGGGGAGSGSGGGGFEGLDVNSLWDASIFDSVQQTVGKIKEDLKELVLDWLPQIQTIGVALAGWTIANLLGQFGEALGFDSKFAKVIQNVKKLAATAIIISLQFKLMEDSFGDFIGAEGTILDYIEGLLIGAVSSYLLYKMWGAGGLTIGLGITAIASLSAIIENGGITNVESAVVALTGLGAALGAVATGASALSDAWKKVMASKFIGDLGAFIALAKEGGFIGTLAAAFPKLSAALAGLPAAITSAGSVLAAAGPWIALAAVVVGGIVLAFVDYDFSEIGYTVGEKIGSAIRNTVNLAINVGKAILEGLKSSFEWLKNALDIEDFTDVLKILFVPGELLRRILPDITELFIGISDWINEKIENLKGNINEFFDGLFTGLFDGLDLGVSFENLVGKIDHFEILSSIMQPWTIGKRIIDAITEGMGANGIKDKLSSLWSDAKTWWNDKKEALKTYTPSIGNIASKLSTAWTDAKNWWNDKRSSLSYTPSIGKIWEKLKSAWTSAKDWWNKSRSSLSYTPSIGSISSKLSSAWTTAKNWWNKNRSSLSYTPSIGSIKDKIVSAWNTAKSWWSKNAKLSTTLDVKVPKITVKWDTAEAFGKSFKYPTGFSLKFAANGGIFDQGSLIWAGERGPEVMAKAAGGKTGVMNVQQMQDAVYEGVYAAVSAAMSGKMGGGSQDVRVYIDGREVSNTVKKYAREGGATIMGNEVYGY